jgi:[NiFe] hydrogenase assembly HybE family chaperone
MMNKRIRIPAFQAPQPPPAAVINQNPTLQLEAMYRRIWETSMHDMPFVNHALRVEVVGFRRWQPGNEQNDSGDWVGAVITPWFLNLFVLPGGGALWSDRPSGERCNIAFPAGALEFISDDDASAEIPAYQYCALITQVSQFDSQEAARADAEGALEAIFTAPAVVQAPQNALPDDLSEPPQVSRRAFFKRVAGR